MARRKSYNDIYRQFNRIWNGSIKMSSQYNPSMNNDDASSFQRADSAIRRSSNQRDIQLNSRIERAEQTARRYLDNLRKKGGYSDATPYYAQGERLDKYTKWTNRKYSRSTYMGKSGTNG